jgi:hypothetical protein
MATPKELKLEQKIAVQHQEIIVELQALVKDIERCETTINALKIELEGVNSRHSKRGSTQEDIDYLEDLLKCAKKKLVWEKQMASLQKRTPLLMQEVEKLVNHPQSHPNDETQSKLMQSLQAVQGAMQRMQSVKIE